MDGEFSNILVALFMMESGLMIRPVIKARLSIRAKINIKGIS
jgi:hypothetical protein